MEKEVNILIAAENREQFELITKNLSRAGVYNKALYFADGPELLHFLFDTDKTPEHGNGEYILLLDLELPKAGGTELLEKVKQDEKLRKMPVIILTASDDQQTVEHCHELGCSTYIVKPADTGDLEKTIQKIAHFLAVVEITPAK